MNRFDFQKMMKGIMEISGQGQLSVPVSPPANASEVTVKRFGIEAPGEVFRTGWEFTIAEPSAARVLKAFAAGSIRYEAAANRIVLTNLDVFGELVRQTHLPKWFPLANFVIYKGIDEQQTRTVLIDYLNQRGGVRRALERVWGPSVLPADLLDHFIAGDLELPVPSGQSLGVAKQIDSASRAVTVSIQSDLGNADNLFIDPATYPANCPEHFTDLAGHPLEMRLKTLFGGLLSNGTIRYVSQTGSANGPFTDPASPANTITLAVEAANPYDSVVILDNGAYQEGAQIEIEQPLTITSLGGANVINDSTLDALPIIDGNRLHRLFWIKEDAGMVSLCNLAIANGRINTDISDTTDPASHHGLSPAGGGGVLIDENDSVYIGNCHIHHNSLAGYRVSRVGGYSAEEGTDESNFGAGIFAYHCSPFLANNRISNNSTDRRGGGIGIWGYGWPIIAGNIIATNVAERSEGGDGGGVAIEIAVPDHDLVGIASLDLGWADEHIEQARQNEVKFINNQIVENSARDDGGGVYLSVMTGAYFERNVIQSNESGSGGGGIRASFGSSVIMEGDSVLNNHTNYLEVPGSFNGGGGIACRDAQLVLNGVQIEDNLAYGWAGGGVLFNSSQEAGVTINDDKYDQILRDVFRPENFTLAIDANSRIANNSCIPLATQTLDRRKGGGLYVLRFVNDVTGFLSLPIKLIIEDVSRVEGNTLVSPPTLEFPDSAQIHIEDLVHRPNEPIDDGSLPEFTANGSFVYESL